MARVKAAATPSRLPDRIDPQLATLVSKPPPGEWLYELKFDGYRILVRIEGTDVRIITRNGNDWTARFPTLVAELRRMKLPTGWYDDEMVAMDDRGQPSFNLLQKAIEGAGNKDIVLFLFDVPFLAGKDLRGRPVEERRARLSEVLQDTLLVRFSEELLGQASSLLASACKMGLEGIICKRRGSRYVSGRSADWIKLKCALRQEFVIGGYTWPDNSRIGIGALLVGYYSADSKLHYAGKVGTGFSGEELTRLRRELDAIQQASRPFVETTGYDRRATWVRPDLVCEVEYREWREDGHLRHPSYKGQRTDKPARQITREGDVVAAANVKPPSIKLSNPDRLIDPASGATKIDLVRYYEAVAPWILPHLKDRPVSLVRAPGGITGQLFFQKHLEHAMPGMQELDASLWPGHKSLLVVNSLEALLSAAQMNVVEFHTWNSTAKSIDRPDRVVFDLDPGEGVTWSEVREAALLTRTLLEELDLQAWVKTSGGKGLHVVVPLAPRLGYERVKAFSQAVVLHMAKTIPQRFVAKAGEGNRVGRIFIDYLRNGHSQTTASAFSARSRPGLGVSMTIGWEDLGKVESGAQWTVSNAVQHLGRRSIDPWHGFSGCRQTLTRALKVLDVP